MNKILLLFRDKAAEKVKDSVASRKKRYWGMLFCSGIRLEQKYHFNPVNPV
jgi:hypothetical protein